VHVQPRPRVTQTTRELLGEPCRRCQVEEARLDGRAGQGGSVEEIRARLLAQHEEAAEAISASGRRIDARALIADVRRRGIVAAGLQHGLTEDEIRRYLARQRQVDTRHARDPVPEVARASLTPPTANSPSAGSRSSRGRVDDPGEPVDVTVQGTRYDGDVQVPGATGRLTLTDPTNHSWSTRRVDALNPPPNPSSKVPAGSRGPLVKVAQDIVGEDMDRRRRVDAAYLVLDDEYRSRRSR
jgi:hypothetical protein